MLLSSSLVQGEEFKQLTFKQKGNGKEFICYVNTGMIVSVNQGYRGFNVERLEHDVAGELKLKITHLWDIPATFEGDGDQEKVRAMIGKTYVFRYKDGVVISVQEVEKTV
jgi:hypothetical protein